MLRFEGAAHFRQRIVCSTLCGKSIKIDNIRVADESPGLRDFEANFLRLIEKITNGCEIIINETGTRVMYKPGFIVGGNISHDCGTSRSIGYFLEGILGIVPFGKQPLSINFTGITNDSIDPSVDFLRTVSLPLLKRFGIEEGLDLKIKKRGAPPNGGGQVIFQCPIVRSLNSIQLIEMERIRRIRGIAYATRVSPQIANRMVDAVRAILTSFQQDIYIYTDHYRGAESGLSPGFGLLLVAESGNGYSLAAETMASSAILPEELGKQAAKLLLAEIQNGGCVDTVNQGLVLLFMTLCTDSISKVRLGKLSPYTIQYLRHLNDFFGITFRIENDSETMTTICTCRGIGFKNLAKRVY